MRALQLVEWQSPVKLNEVPVPEVGAGQVLVKVGAAGACHSDLHLMEWPAGVMPWRLPFTLGHENAGWVEEVGPGVTGFARGDAVIVFGPWGCGRCKPCRLGRENYCERAGELGALGGGLGLDGGMAEYMLVPSARLLVPLHGLHPAQAAPLADAALTPYHAIKHSLALLEPGSTAVVIGAGGLGQMAIQLLRALSCAQIVAVDKAPDKLALAKEVGAEHALTAGEDAAARIRQLTRGVGAELVLDVVGSDETLALGAASLRAEGHLTLLGLAGGSFPLSFFGVPYGATLRTSYWGTITELMEVVKLAETGAIKSRVETYPLAQAPDVYHKLSAGEIKGRAVIVPNPV